VSDSDPNMVHMAGDYDGRCGRGEGRWDVSADQARDDLSRFFELSIDMLCVAGFDGYFRRVNPAFERILGYTKQELLARPFIDFVHPDDKAATRDEMEKLSAGVPTVLFVNRYRCKDGAFKWISWTSSPARAEGLVYAVARDITERKQIIDAIRLERDRLMNLLGAMEDGVCIVDAQMNIEYANPALEREFGPASGRKCCEYLAGRDERCPACHDGQAFADRPARREWYSARNNKHYDLFTAPLREPDGSVSKFKLFHDITPRKRAEEKARQHESLLAHISRLYMVSEMASSLAHELNQPLFAIVSATEGALRVLRSETPDYGEVQRAVGIAAEQAKRAGAIIHRVRRMVQRREPQHSPIDVTRMIRDAVALLGREVREKCVVVRFELGDQARTVSADAVQTEQVILNLVRNALEAMDGKAGGERVLTVRATAADHEFIEIAVCDSGPGLSSDMIERVFTPFFTTKPDGLGLGLGICRSIVESHGGRLWVTPNADAGVTFHFTLPVGPASPQDDGSPTTG
jgi:PAS domain S-box-containing protein